MGNFAKIASVGLILFITSIMGVHTVMAHSSTDAYEPYANVPDNTKVILFPKGAALINPTQKEINDTKGIVSTAGEMRKFLKEHGLQLTISSNASLHQKQQHNLKKIKLEDEYIAQKRKTKTSSKIKHVKNETKSKIKHVRDNHFDFFEFFKNILKKGLLTVDQV